MDRLDSAFFPPIEPRRSGHLEVDNLHAIYWEEVGNPDGIPLVVLHGGPGGGIRWYHRCVFDPVRFRCIVFDQRGCGQSTPFGCLERNTTGHLVSDMEALRKHLEIDRWIVMGGSWGSALSLAYAVTHPDRCLAIVVYAVIVERKSDLWWWWEGVRFVYPEVWAAFAEALPEAERSDLRSNYVRRVLHPDPKIHGPAAAAWLRYEAQTLDIWPDEAFVNDISVNPATIGAARVFAHYDAHNFFLKEEELLHKAGCLAGIPGIIINGRFDMCTPPLAAFDLHRAWSGSELTIVPAAGHRWTDGLIAREVIRGIAHAADLVEGSR